MKKSLLILALAFALTQAAVGQVGSSGTSGATFVITPSSQNVAAGGTFNVDFSLTGTAQPVDISGYDLYLVISSAYSGLFTITTSTPTGPLSSDGPDFSMGGGSISTAASPGYVRNGENLGYTGPDQSSPYSFNLQTLTIAVSAGAAPGTYTFFTSTDPTAGAQYSDVIGGDTDGFNTYDVVQSQFSITIVPEPSTWAVFLLGLGVVGFVSLRRRRATN